VPRHEMREFQRFLTLLAYPYVDESRNPAYRLFSGLDFGSSPNIRAPILPRSRRRRESLRGVQELEPRRLAPVHAAFGDDKIHGDIVRLRIDRP